MTLVLVNGIIITSATALGSLTGLLGSRISNKGIDLSLGFASGIMIVASFLSLIVPAMKEGFYIDVGIGIAIGMFLIVILDKFLPHEHDAAGYEGPKGLRDKIRRAWLIALAMIIHNIPEGLAVGVSTMYNRYLGLATTIAISLQDIVEGVVTSLPLASLEGKQYKAVSIGVLSGVIEFATALGGAMIIKLSRSFLGIGMGLAAGAMIYVVVEELLPELFHRHSENRKIATLGFVTGIYTMLYMSIFAE